MPKNKNSTQIVLYFFFSFSVLFVCRALPSLRSGNNFRAENWSSTIFEIYFRDPSGDVFILFFFSSVVSHFCNCHTREREANEREWSDEGGGRKSITQAYTSRRDRIWMLKREEKTKRKSKQSNIQFENLSKRSSDLMWMSLAYFFFLSWTPKNLSDVDDVILRRWFGSCYLLRLMCM